MDSDSKFINTCRCCLSEEGTMKNMVVEKFEVVDKKIKILFLEGYTILLGIDMNEVMCRGICRKCEEKLKASYEFRELCHDSYKVLKERADMEVKEELLSDNEDNDQNFVYQDFEQKPSDQLSQQFSQVFVRDKTKVVVLAEKNKATKPLRKPETKTEGLKPATVEETVQQIVNTPAILDEAAALKVETEKYESNESYNDDDTQTHHDEGSDEDEDKPLVAKNEKRKRKTTKKEKPLFNVDVESMQANYICYYCDTFLPTHNEYVKHRENHMADRSSHRLERKCNICNEQVQGYFTHIEQKHRDYRPNTCKICPKGKYQSPNDLKHHLYTHTMVSISRCLSCNKDFKSQNQLRWHIATESHSKELYHCPYCGLGFPQFMPLNLHFKLKHKAISVKKLFPCFTCKKIYVVKKYFLNHECMKNATIAAATAVPAEDKKKRAKKDHLPTLDTGVLKEKRKKDTNLFKCERCASIFNNEDEFVCHQNSVCEEPPKFICPTCDKEFETRRSLSRHKATHVERNRVFICDLCGTSTTSEFKLKLHKVSHKTERPFNCPLCPSTFKTEQHLKNHQDFHKERKYECDMCGKKFRFHHTIKTHMATHVRKTCTSELRKFSCDFCERTFVRARDRERHLKMHTDDRPVKCNLCTREFRDNGGLNEHYRRVHEGIYYECSLCGKKYAQRLKLKDHLFVHRGFNPYHCPTCPQQFIKKWLYKRHLLNHSITYVEKVHGYRETEDLREILLASIRIPTRNSDNTVQRHHEQPIQPQPPPPVPTSNLQMDNSAQHFHHQQVQRDRILMMQPPTESSVNCAYITTSSAPQPPPPLNHNGSSNRTQHEQHRIQIVGSGGHLTMLQSMDVDDKNVLTSMMHLQ